MISILCPTRKRPDKLERMVISARDTATTPFEILSYVDDDDHSYEDQYFPLVKFIRGPRMMMSDMWNVLIPHATGDIYMLCGDDCIFRTKGWSAMVEDAFANSIDKILMVHGDDGSPPEQARATEFATHPFVHKRWVEIVGYFTGPGFSCDFADAWVNDVAEMIGRRKYLPFITDHMHAVWGKAEYDEVYQESNARRHRDHPELKYLAELPLREADAAKLRAVML